MSQPTLINQLSVIRDFRQPGKVQHELIDVLFLAITAVISGCEGWEEIEDFGNDKLNWLRQYLPFEEGIPSDDTISRLFQIIEPKEFQKSFAKWMKSCCEMTHGDIIAIDGKTLKGSFKKKNRSDSIHMVSAFASANSVVLGQVKTSEKSNEITAIPKLLDLLDIRGCLITIDAMGCQTKIAKKIVDKGGDYLLPVKGNQERLQKALNNLFSISRLEAKETETYTTSEKGHGREETRHCMVADASEMGDLAFEWTGLKKLGYVVSFRTEKGEKTTTAFKFYISSAELDAKSLLTAAREHWSVENNLHWQLDISMNEDACRIRQKNSTENLATVRHVALNLLKTDGSFKGGIKRKHKQANRSDDYRETIVSGLSLISS
jgi:predicted transposase YbfD/YdcC